MGLPLNQPAEVWLKGGIRLRGVLRLKEEQLFVPEHRDPFPTAVPCFAPGLPLRLPAASSRRSLF